MEEGVVPEKVEFFEIEDEEIDIYLFSNGQQYSPPRKYHLRVEELRCWEATLSLLARLQYGSLHTSIQLFELDGRKLENPTEVRDCAVYVAVVPPDPFIYAGYDKYLVKASRSYERRFAKKADGEQCCTDATSPTGVTTALVKGSEISPMYLNIEKNSEVKKSSLKNTNQKQVDRIKPVANQGNQRLSRNLNINSLNLATKKIYNNRKDESKNSSKLSTTSGMAGKNSTSDRVGSIVRSKSPAKTLSFNTSTHKEDGIPQKSVNSSHGSCTINRKVQDSSNKLNSPSLFKKTNLKNKTITKKVDTLSDNPNISINTIRKSVHEIPKPTTKQRNYVISKILPLVVDDKMQSTRKDAVTLPRVDKILESSSNASSMGVQMQALTSDEKDLTNNKINASNIIKEVNASMTNGITKATNTSRISIITEDKLTSTEYNMSIQNQVVKEIVNDFFTSNVKNNSAMTEPFISISNEIKEINSKGRIIMANETILSKPVENLPKNQNDALYATKDITEFSKLSLKEVPKLITRSNDINLSRFNEVLDINAKDKITIINETKNSKLDDSLKLNIDLVSILNETRECTEPQSFILKSEEGLKSKSQELFMMINKTIDQSVKPSSSHNIITQNGRALAMYENTKTNTGYDAPIDKIKISTVKATPTAKYEYIDISVVSTENKINTTIKSTLNTDEQQTNSNENFSSVSENFYNLKVPILYHVPEMTLNLINKDEIADKGALNNNAFPSTNTSTPVTDTAIKIKDVNLTKTHSYTFYSKQDNNNTVRNIDATSNPKKELVKIPITNIVKDKDFVQINIFRSPFNDSLPTNIDLTDGKQFKIQKCKDDDNNDMENDCLSECNQISDGLSLKQPDISTTLINRALEKNSTHFVSNIMTNDETESGTDQFIAVVQNGDIVNLKLSIQIKESAGIIISMNDIDLHNSSNVNQLPSDEIDRTPNEITRSKSLQSDGNDSPPHICCRKKDKVVVYQCACCENKSYTLAANPLNPSLQGLYVLLPVVTPVQESVKTCNQTCDKQVQYTESLPKVQEKSVHETHVALADNSIQSKLIMTRKEASQTSSRMMDSKIQQTNRTTQDRFTQTDWCDILLEAQAEPDGQYTFYLPPLHLLQQYCLH